MLSFSCELNATFLRLLPRRFSLIRQRMEIEALRHLLEPHQKEQSRILELMKQHNLDCSRDQRRWEVLQDNFDFESKSASQILKKSDELSTALFMEQTRFSEECCSENMRLSRLLTPVVLAFRKELGLPIDEKEYTKLVDQIAVRQNERINTFPEEMKNF